MKPLDLWIDNDNLIVIQDLTDESTGELITGATVDITIKGPAGEAFGDPGDWPVGMAEQAPGHYSGTIRYDVPLQPGPYQAKIDVVTSTGGVGSWTKRVTARIRA